MLKNEIATPATTKASKRGGINVKMITYTAFPSKSSTIPAFNNIIPRQNILIYAAQESEYSSITS